MVAGSTAISGFYFPGLASPSGATRLLAFDPSNNGRITHIPGPVTGTTVILGPSFNISTGANNVILGVGAAPFTAAGSGSIILGANATGDRDNAIVIGTNQTSFRIPVTAIPGPYTDTPAATGAGLISGMLYWSTGSSADSRVLRIVP